LFVLWPFVVGQWAAYLLRSRGCSRRARAVPVAVGVASGLVGVAMHARFGPTPRAVHGLLVGGVLAVCAGVDLACSRIPNPAVLAGVLLALAGAVVYPGLREAVLGGAAAFVLVLLPALLKPGVLGEGDAKMAALVGLAVGQRALPLALGASVLAGAGVSVALLLAGRIGMRDRIPFGPFLALGGIVGLFNGGVQG